MFGACGTLTLAAALLASCTDKDPPAASAAATTSAALSAADAAPPAQRPSGPTAGPAIEATCRDICDHSQKLNCKNAAECTPNCIGMATTTPCSKEVGVLYACLVKQPAPNWECTADGVASIRDGFCDKEQMQTVRCMESRMAR